jgi:hypothetical protein
MDIGVIVGFVFGVMFIFFGFLAHKKRNWKKNGIKKWISEPQTLARIIGTVDNHNLDHDASDYDGYNYRAEILVDGVWYKAKSWDNFYGKPICKNGDEVMVAYRPIKESSITKTADAIMGAMTKTLLNRNWEEEKPRYWFKFLDKHVYDNEKQTGSAIFFVCFGLAILLMSVLAHMGMI